MRNQGLKCFNQIRQLADVKIRVQSNSLSSNSDLYKHRLGWVSESVSEITEFLRAQYGISPPLTLRILRNN